jgi:hypothetical protein
MQLPHTSKRRIHDPVWRYPTLHCFKARKTLAHRNDIHTQILHKADQPSQHDTAASLSDCATVQQTNWMHSPQWSIQAIKGRPAANQLTCTDASAHMQNVTRVRSAQQCKEGTHQANGYFPM